MIAQGQIHRILASQLDFTELTWRLSPLPLSSPSSLTAEDEALAASIHRVGLLHPPIVRPTGDLYQLLSGQRRAWLAVHHLHFTALPCLVIPADAEELEMLILTLAAITGKRPPTAMELARFSHRLLALLGADRASAAADAEITRVLASLPGISLNPFQVRRYAELVHLEEPFAVALHQGRLQETVAREMLALSLPERLALFELIEWLQLSAGNQKKLTAIGRELSRREKVSLLKILGSDEIRRLLDHPAMNLPQKTTALMRHLQVRRYPQLSAAEEEFKTWCRSLQLPPTWQLTPTRSFEDRRVTLSINLEDRELLNDRLPLLRAAVEGDNQPHDD